MILMGIMGILSWITMFSLGLLLKTETENSEIEKEDSHIYKSENPFSSMLRGLVVYFAFLTGVFVASPNPFGTTTPQQYARTAGVVPHVKSLETG